MDIENMVVTRVKRVEVVKGKESQIYGDERWMMMGGGHKMQYTNHVSENCILETHMILLTKIFNNKKIKQILEWIEGDWLGHSI